jgi:hypothetical protein
VESARAILCCCPDIKVIVDWVKSCPLHYTSPNASRVRDVLGTLMLGVLSGSKRYAHLAGIRGDQVATQELGLTKIASEDSVRRALSAMDPQTAQSWMQRHQTAQGCTHTGTDHGDVCVFSS